MSGSFNPINLVSQVALGIATGGTSLVAQLAMQVVSQVVQQVVQEVGEQLNLPQGIIDTAKDAATGAMTGGFAGAALGAAAGAASGGASSVDDSIEQFGQATGASPAQIGDAQRSAHDLIRQQAAEAMETEEARDAKAGGGKGGWLRAIARAMGEAADKTAEKLEQDAKKLDNATPSQSAEYNADAQAFSMLMNAINTAIKAIGEALATQARKQ